MITFTPNEMAPVRFVTSLSISQDVRAHGIDGFFRDGRFWSTDGADHWTPREVTWWEYAEVPTPPTTTFFWMGEREHG